MRSVCMAFDARDGVLHTARGATSDLGARRAAWEGVARGAYDVRLEERVYLFVEPRQKRGPLTALEIAVAHAAAQALPGKEIAYALGIAPSTVSMTLGSATAKVGLASVTELARLVRALVVIAPVETRDDSLSEAEREVLELLLAGKTNAEIADARKRSVRTVANQVASILRKTGSPSRHVLRVKS